MEQLSKFQIELINRYKHLVTNRHLKTVDELSEFLENKLSAVPIAFSEFNQTTRKVMMMSIECKIKDEKLNLDLNDLEFLPYIIPKNGCGANYYNYPYTNAELRDKDMIYVILEKHINYYMHCNSPKLFLDLAIERGVSQYDYDNNTSKLILYLMNMDSLKKRIYEKPVIDYAASKHIKTQLEPNDEVSDDY